MGLRRWRPPGGYTVSFDHVSLTAAGTALPPMPENLKVETSGSTALKLSWGTQGHVSAYKLCRATSPDGPFVTLATNLSEPSYVDDSLEPATTYYYKVWSSNAAGESNGCAEGSASTSALSSWLSGCMLRVFTASQCRQMGNTVISSVKFV